MAEKEKKETKVKKETEKSAAKTKAGSAKTAAKDKKSTAKPKTEAAKKSAKKPVDTAATTAGSAKKPKSTKNVKAAVKTLVLKVPHDAYYGTGRRKSAVARAWVFPGSGQVAINNQPMDDYLARPVLSDLVMLPLRTLKMSEKYNVVVKTKGGGISGQAGAIQLGIARALLSMNEDFRRPLRGEELLTRDSRVKERKKYGKRGARKGPQYRKR